MTVVKTTDVDLGKSLQAEMEKIQKGERESPEAKNSAWIRIPSAIDDHRTKKEKIKSAGHGWKRPSEAETESVSGRGPP